jgi:hypothetical protein
VIFVTADDSQPSQDIPPRRQTLQGLWNTDTHLFLWARTRRCLDSYQKTSLTVVHPAILDELNTAWYLSSDQSSQEHSPLSLNITIAICLGKHFPRPIRYHFNGFLNRCSSRRRSKGRTGVLDEGSRRTRVALR